MMSSNAVSFFFICLNSLYKMKKINYILFILQSELKFVMSKNSRKKTQFIDSNNMRILTFYFNWKILAKAVESKMKVIIWGDERFSALKGVHWNIKFVPVTSCPNQVVITQFDFICFYFIILIELLLYQCSSFFLAYIISILFRIVYSWH